jgi:hypothetical protein
VAGLATGAVAMLAVAVPALSQPEGSGDNFKKDEVFKVTTVIQVPGAAAFFSFDISWFDPKLKKFFLADRNNKAIDVVDATSPDAIKQFPQAFAGVNPGGNDFSGPDGVLTANNGTELWVGDSPGRVWVLDSGNGQKIALPAPATNPILVTNPGPPVRPSTTRADELCYDPKDNLIMIASPAEDPMFVSFISTAGAKKGQVVGQIKFGAPATGLEQCGWSPKTGMFYQNVPADPGGQDTVAVINPTKMAVDHSINIDACKGVRGMAIGPDSQILIGCTAPGPGTERNSVVINDSGGVLKVLTGLGGVDEVWFNPDDGHYVLPSCNTECRKVPGGGPELLGIVDSRGFRLDHSVTIGEPNGFTTVVPGVNPRTTHSVTAGGNQIFLPIPAVGGTTAPQFDPTLCDSLPDGTITRVGNPSSTTGCIAILAAKKDDHSRVAKERENDDRQD